MTLEEAKRFLKGKINPNMVNTIICAVGGESEDMEIVNFRYVVTADGPHISFDNDDWKKLSKFPNIAAIDQHGRIWDLYTITNDSIYVSHIMGNGIGDIGLFAAELKKNGQDGQVIFTEVDSGKLDVDIIPDNPFTASRSYQEIKSAYPNVRVHYQDRIYYPINRTDSTMDFYSVNISSPTKHTISSFGFNSDGTISFIESE